MLVSGDMVLPAHGKPFLDLRTRIKQLCDHHAARLAEVIDACRASFAAPWIRIN